MFRKRRKRVNNRYRLFVIGIMMPIFIIVCFLLKQYLFAIIALVIFLGILILRNPVTLGYLGERKVSKILNKVADKCGGKVINDIIIVDEEGKSSQIDHIFLHRSGIYVVETKRYSGRIYGSKNDHDWTQVLAYGHTKHKLYNPIMQNATHIRRLKEILDNEKYIYKSIIVFVRNNIDYIDSESISTARSLKKDISFTMNEVNLTDAEIDKIYFELLEYKDNPLKSKKEHVKEIKKTQKDISNNICPHCHTPLVKKTSKYGKEFYGCINYPKCKFTKK